MAELFDVADLSAYLQQELDFTTASLARDQATNYLRRELGVEFAEESRTLTDRIPADATFARLLGPLVSVESVTVAGTLLAATDYERTRRGVLCPAGFGASADTDYVDLSIVYTGGFDAIPGDLRDAGLQLAALSYLRPRPGVKSSSSQIDDYQVSETYVEDAGSAVVTLDPWTLRDLRGVYGARRPRAGSVAYR